MLQYFLLHFKIYNFFNVLVLSSDYHKHGDLNIHVIIKNGKNLLWQINVKRNVASEYSFFWLKARVLRVFEKR